MWLVFLTIWALVVDASYDYGMHSKVLANRQASSKIVTTGAPVLANGSIPLRLEVNAMQNHTDAWTLYILALDWMQFQDQTTSLSWYGLTGIHGRPYKSWDGVEPTAGNHHTGYCAHVSILFPTWHRPYLALFEQTVNELANTIATLYPAGPVRERYQAVAKTLRIPYWDWATAPPSGQPIFPSSVGGSKGVSVAGPAGVQTIANPLYNYFFAPFIPSDLPEAPLVHWNQTLRYPTTMTSDAVSQDPGVESLFITNQPTLRSRLYNLMTNTFYSNYSLWASEEWYLGNPSGGYDSIESIHDEVHGLSGAGGHMTYIEYSSFDPVFFLHHANVDRLFAMWQILNPESYVLPTKAAYATFTNSAGHVQDNETILTPFRDNSTAGYWTSSSVRDIEIFNYQYPETQNPNGATLFDMQTYVRQRINRLYGSVNTIGSSKSKVRSLDDLSEGVVSSIASRGSSPGTAKYRAWAVNIVASKNYYGSPYFVHIYLGDSLMGSHFVNAPLNVVSNLTKVSGTIPLELFSYNTTYLATNLRHRVTLADGSEAGSDGVLISLVSSEVTPSAGYDVFPIYSDYVDHGGVAGII